MIVTLSSAVGSRDFRFVSDEWLDATAALATGTPSGKFTLRFKEDRNDVAFGHTTFYVIRVSDTSLAIWCQHWGSFSNYRLTVEQVEYQGAEGPEGRRTIWRTEGRRAMTAPLAPLAHLAPRAPRAFKGRRAMTGMTGMTAPLAPLAPRAPRAFRGRRAMTGMTGMTAPLAPLAHLAPRAPRAFKGRGR